MTQNTINKYLDTIVQKIEFTKFGIIVNSNDELFPIGNAKSIYDIHPFFEIFKDLLDNDVDEELFKIIQLQINDVDLIVDVLFHKGSKSQNAFILLFDKTEFFNEIQQITQDKNELFISNYKEYQKNIKLIDEKVYKNKFLASITHDLKTPISGVLGLLELFKKDNLSYEQKEIISTISSTVSHLDRLVNDVFDLSKIEYGNFKIEHTSFNMDELINNIERVYLEKFILKGVDFKIVKSSKLPSKLIGDYNRVLQILTNIIENAYKYTNKGEVILKINLDYRRAKAIRVRFSVEDTGVGFVKEHNTKFESFKKYHKEDFSGSGLGLSIVTNLIQLMNGSFTFDSILNEGSVFIVNLPFNIELESDNLKKKTPKFSKIDIKVKYNVLITDDNEINQLVLTKLLLNHGGFYIDLANNGKHAIEMAKKEKYDLIFMDLQMPIMNGFEAIEILNNDKETKNTKIIALSAFDTVQDKEIGIKLNVDDYVVKPFSKEELFTSIYKVLKIKKESTN